MLNDISVKIRYLEMQNDDTIPRKVYKMISSILVSVASKILWTNMVNIWSASTPE